MIDVLLKPFEYGFMIKAMWVCGVVGLACGVISCFVTLKGWSLMGDALAHAIVPGVVLAYLIGAPFALGAFVSGMAAAGVMGLVKAGTRLREDAVMGLVFTTFFAAGVLLISVFPSNINLKSIVMGNIFGIDPGDARQIVIVSVIALAVLALKGKDLVLYCFDPAQAVATGRSVAGLHFLLLALLAATTVAALQAVGVILVIAMLVTPGATAYLLTDRFGRMVAIASAMGATTSVVGIYLSHFANASPGGTIVLLQTLVFLAALFLAPKHGVLATRRRGRREAAVPEGGAT